jgi:polyisoprenoid-binding protein YceI
MLKAVLFLGFLALGAPLQSSLDKSDTKITVLGTSTLHDWEMESTDYYTTGSVSFNGSSVTSNNYKIYFPVKKILSGKETMDEYAQEALNAEDHKNIVFALSSVSDSKANGTLSIAGSSKKVAIPVKINTSGNKASVSGTVKINMPAYDVEPPSVMFGTIVCGDDVDINFQFAFNLK